VFDITADVFMPCQDGRYQRIHEEQKQRAHSKEELSGWLDAAGFSNIRFFGDRTFRAPGSKALRWHVTAVKGE